MPEPTHPPIAATSDTPSDTPSSEPPPLVSARGLVKRFGEFVAVDGVDFDIARGESFGFLGPNGAGKTSTMRMVASMSPLSGGTLRIFGLDPATDGPRIRSRIGIVPQEDSLDLQLTVLDNLVVYGRYFDLPRAEIREPRPASARVHAADRSRQRYGRAVVGWHETPAHYRPLPDLRA